MIQLAQQQHGEFVGGWWGGWLTPTTYIQLAVAGSIFNKSKLLAYVSKKQRRLTV